MKKLIAALTGVALVGAMAVSSPASADKKGEPAESGVVVRFDPAIGGHGVGPVTANVNGEDRTLVAIIGFDDATVLCDPEGEPVENGVIQIVETPSGNFSEVVHNSDAPVLVFDVTEIEDEDEFFFLLCTGQLDPFAWGTVKQRPIIIGDDTGLTQKIKSMGVVTDDSGQDWKLQTFLKAEIVFGVEGSDVQGAWIKLTLL